MLFGVFRLFESFNSSWSPKSSWFTWEMESGTAYPLPGSGREVFSTCPWVVLNLLSGDDVFQARQFLEHAGLVEGIPASGRAWTG